MKTFLEYTNDSPAFPGARVVPDYAGVHSKPRPAGDPPEIGDKMSAGGSGNEPRPMGITASNLDDPRIIDTINNKLEIALNEKFLTPYIALERVRKTLAPYGIVIPAVAWMSGEVGERVFPIFQWGGIIGTKGDTSFDTNMEAHPTYTVYISWSYDDSKDSYDIYAGVVNAEQLNDLLNKDFDGTPFDDLNDKAQAMSEACWKDYKQVGMKKKGGKTVPNCVPEESAAWQRKDGKNPEGGLNRKGVESYRRENPGSKLKMAVTTKPSKLDPDSKPAKRRKSFCARMGGMPGPMKDEKGRPTRKALSLRKWNC
jgi:hypothetical protein